jgi:hypothetical protein
MVPTQELSEKNYIKIGSTKGINWQKPEGALDSGEPLKGECHEIETG